MISLGIDVGGTASRWVALDAQGLEIGRGATPGATGHLFAALERQRFEAMAETIAAHRPSGQVGRIHIGATGLGPAMHGDAAAILSLHLGAPVSAISCSDDMDLAYRAAFAPGEGHLVSAGTGSIGLHVMANGTLVRVGGRGLLIDDGGSGTWIALNALDRIYRRIDETGAPADAAILARHVFAAIGGDDWDVVKGFIYGTDRGRIGTLAKPVAEAAHEGDPVALQLMSEAGAEIARLGQALIARAGQKPVAIVGGVVLLHPAIKAAIAANLPGSPTYPQIDAALAAARIAFDTLA